MTRLILIRHAKSGWDDPMADDHDRTLTARGRKAATAIGEWLLEKGYVPDIVISSDAARTRETAQYLLAAFDVPPPVQFAPMLYHASPDTVLDFATRPSEPTIAIIGHNPGIGMAAHALVRQKPAHRRFSDYPTCATTVIDFTGKIALGAGDLVDFIVPRDLVD